MYILEKIINIYYFYKDIMLFVFIIMFLFLTIIVLVKRKKPRNIMNKLLHDFFGVLIVGCTGMLINLLGLMPKIERVDACALIFVMIVGIVFIYGIFQAIMFRKVIIPALKVCVFVKYTVFFEIFLLSGTAHLEVKEAITGILAVFCIELIVELLNGLQRNGNTIVIKESDYPSADLYNTRRRQLEKFLPILEQQKSEPYAIMISGEWGTGKSSFMLALEKRAEKDAFIWVQAGSEKSVSEIMLEISEQILDILRENNILVEREGLIEKYFLAFAGVLGETKLNLFCKIASAFQKKPEDTKKYLNSKLDELKKLNKMLYLVIDDLDRCDKEYQLKMFKVIRESTQLIRCKTIFLVDKNEFLAEEYKLDYIEKYVNYTLELCTVNYKEIVDYLVNDLFGDEFFSKTSRVLLKDRSFNEIKEMICQFPDKVLEKCEREISEARNVKSEHNDERNKGKINDIEEAVLSIKKNITNSRKVKNFLKGMKRDIGKLNGGIEDCSQQYQKEDWLRAVMEVHFLKNMLPDIYNLIRMTHNLMDFEQKHESHSAQIVLGLRSDTVFFDEKKKTILNYIIYDVDVIDFTKVMVAKEKYLSELHGDEASIKHISEYIKYAGNYDDFSKILNVFARQKVDSNEEREDNVKMILNALSRQTIFDEENNHKFLDLSKELIRCLKGAGLSKKEKNICVNEGQRIISKVIRNNVYLLRKILFVLFELDKTWRKWKSFDVTNIDELYVMLKNIDGNSVYMRGCDESDRFASVKCCYNNLINELRGEKYKGIGLDLDEISSELNKFFEICEFWLDIESVLNSESDSDITLFDQYYWLDGMYSPKDFIFFDVLNLIQALEALDGFYNLKAECYESKFTLILYRVLFRIVLRYEGDKDCFEGREREINDLLKKIASKVYLLDNSEDNDDKEVIEEIKIFIYKFNSYCGSE